MARFNSHSDSLAWALSSLPFRNKTPQTGGAITGGWISQPATAPALTQGRLMGRPHLLARMLSWANAQSSSHRLGDFLSSLEKWHLQGGDTYCQRHGSEMPTSVSTQEGLSGHSNAGSQPFRRHLTWPGSCHRPGWTIASESDSGAMGGSAGRPNETEAPHRHQGLPGVWPAAPSVPGAPWASGRSLHVGPRGIPSCTSCCLAACRPGNPVCVLNPSSQTHCISFLISFHISFR